ncbi:M48 family metalloprotease [Magnetospirillum aberrantis]|uniref:M48 family metallopeptidase n=1 Tax=Magnetospirillum aberrantis SpK TaxID=908842 RepID=A0A7C9QSF0_9PROT|nr:M48 family metalloprotease [Magnetospirillum aberrantis]NFV79242.1 M48 family metallopeptidase [Magnetospirillum aberrantis SpK]
MFTRLFLLATLVLTLVAPVPATAQQTARRSFIRDAEVENTIRAYATPLFQAAGLDPDAVRIHLLVDPTLNAFVAGGQNMFFHTGLLIRSERPSQLIGVIAHETGHISGGHLIRIQDAVGNAATEAVMGMLLGAALGAASGRGDLGSAVMMGSQEIATRNLMAFSRTQEGSADQAALSFLDTTRQSAKGFLEFFEILGDQELLVSTRQDPYVRTHPLTRDRVANVREHVASSPYSNNPDSPEFIEMHKRMRAKLFAFLESPVRTLQRYKENDNSLDSRYARAIAAYRKPDMDTALPLIDGLIAERPKDPYFWELKGQMLFENGRGIEALEPYRQAVSLLPDNALLRIGLAQVEVEQEDPSLLEDAKAQLNKALQSEPENHSAWRLLGITYNRLGEEGMAAYAMAEQTLLEGRASDAAYHAGKAERLLPHTGSIWLRIQDIKERAAQAQKQQPRR